MQYTKVYDKDFRLNTNHIIKFLIQLSKSQSTRELKITYMERQNINSQNKKTSRSQDDSSNSSQSVNGSQPRKSLKMETDLPELPIGIPQYIISYPLLRYMIKENQLHKYTINGIVLYFPHRQPNAPQKKFIQKMFESLENGLRKEETQRMSRMEERQQNGEQVRERLYHNNLLIESSTGTGKTLALLYGSMSWAEHKYIEKMKVFLEQLKKKEITQKYFDYQAIIAQRKIIYSSRAHSQLSQISKQLEKTPFRPNMLIFGGKQKLCINEVVKFENKIAKQNQQFQEWQKKCGAANTYQRMFNGRKNPQYMDAVDDSKNAIFDQMMKLRVNQLRMDQQMLKDYQEASKIVRKYLYKQGKSEETRNMHDFFGIGQNQNQQNQQNQQNNANNFNQRMQDIQDERERRQNQRRIRQEERLRNLRKSKMSRYDIVNRLSRQQNEPIEEKQKPNSQDHNNQQTTNSNLTSSNGKTNFTNIYNQRYQKVQSEGSRNISNERQTTNNKQAPKRMRMQNEGSQPQSEPKEKRQNPRNNFLSRNFYRQRNQSQPQQPQGGQLPPQQSLKWRLLALEKLHFLISKVYPTYTNLYVAGNTIKEIDSQYQHLLSMESRCPHFHPNIRGETNIDQQFFKSMERKLLNNKTLAQYASQNSPTLCPHFYPKRVKYMGTFYLMPYNYLLTQIIQQRSGDLFRNAIVIFDEGHNVTSTASSGYSMKMLPNYFKDALKNIHDKDQDDDEKKLNRKKKQKGEKQDEKEEQENLNLTADDLQEQAEWTRKNLQEKRKLAGKNPSDDPHGADYFEDDDNNEQMPNEQQRRKNQGSRNRREKQLAGILTATIQNHLQNFQNFFNQIQNDDFKHTTDYRQKYIFTRTPFTSSKMTEFKQYNNEIRVDNLKYIKNLIFNNPNLTQEAMKMKLQQIIKDLQAMIEFKIEKINQIQEHNKTHTEKIYKKIYYFKIVQLLYCYKKIYKLFFDKTYNHKFYLRLTQSIIKLKNNNLKFAGMLEVICLSPEFAMKALQAINPLSMILTSGTLKPINLLQRELAIEFTDGKHAGDVMDEKNTCIRVVRRLIDINKSSKNQVIDDQNQEVIIDSKFYDINGKPIQSNLKQLIRTLIEIIQKIPNGVLLMLSSKGKVNCIQKFLNGPNGKHLLLQLKQIKPFIGFETGKDVMKNVDKFKQNAVDKGALMFCVCRGKLSEGIDFKDKLCRGVIFIGIPLLPWKQPKLVQKTTYMRKFYPQYEKTYLYIEVAKSINQSLGRVVRHQFDYGSIILLDNRYAESKGSVENTILNLSDWIRDQCQKAPSIQHLKRELGQFFIKSKEYYSQFYDEEKVEIDEVQRSYAQELRPIINGNILPVILQEQLFRYVRRNPIQDQQFRYEQPMHIQSYQQDIENQRLFQQCYDQLKISVFTKGFTLHNIESDGNCLFRTLSKLITRNTQEDYSRYREQIMIDIRRSKNQLIQNLVVEWKDKHPIDSDLSDNAIFNKYLGYYSRNKTLGGARELITASKLYGVGFMIHVKEGTHSILCCEDLRLTEHNLLHIAFLKIDDNENKNHYMALGLNNQQFLIPSFNKDNYLEEINVENTKNGKALVM